MSRRRPTLWIVSRASLALAAWAAGSLGCGHAVSPAVDFNFAPRFDFGDPPCPAADRPTHPADPADPADAADAADPADPADPAAHANTLVARYLGAGGLYLEWQGEGLLTGPFFSNPGLLRTGLGRIRFDRPAIRRGLEGVPTATLGAILAGHSHYDHVGDLPVVAGEMAPAARIYVNRSGANALDAYPDLAARTLPLEGLRTGWTQLTDATGRPLPFRVYPVRSGHAPHVDSITLWACTTPPGGRPWTERRYSALQMGQPFALVIDLLASAAVDAPTLFRLYYQDAASRAPLGVPPPQVVGDGIPFDLAVVCMASADLVPDYPAELLAEIRPRHVLVTHYEDFFSSWGPGKRFVVRLTERRANRFLTRIGDTLSAVPVTGSGPLGGVCSPSSAYWTMPQVGEWMAFSPGSGS